MAVRTFFLIGRAYKARPESCLCGVVVGASGLSWEVKLIGGRKQRLL